MQIDTILEKYKPVIYFHKDEKYFPCHPDYFIKNSNLIKNNKIIDSNMNQTKLYNYSKNDDLGDIFIQPTDDKVIYGFNYNYEDSPLYYFIRESIDKLYIYFFLFFGYNGSYNILNVINIGEHYNDIEHFTYEFDKKTNSLSRIFFSAHGKNEGIWIKSENLEYVKNTSKPVIYCAKYGHGFYPNSGCIFRLFGFANDMTNKGFKYSDYDYNKISKETDINFNPDTSGWFYSGIKYGFNGTKEIHSRNYIKQEENGKKVLFYIHNDIHNIIPNLFNLGLFIFTMKLLEYYLNIKVQSKKIVFLFFIYLFFIFFLNLLKETIKKVS